MIFTPTSLSGVFIIEPKVIADHRGYFMEVYREELFKEAGISKPFIQDNQSSSLKGTLRGLHIQKSPKGQGKLVRCIRGRIFDVAVDVRPNSPTFKQWVGVELSDTNKKMLYIPPDCAHGFYVLSDVAEMLYKCSDSYAPTLERTLKWDDPSIGIKWPIDETPLILSEKDQKGLALKDFMAS